ncbi:gamma-glutamyl hydrolase-like [Pollicipes pollicipes]|uniref:gamma-glutamyl hydrolase-like n=1 Tax=Pollicipes pollicipes TaxID=41117 RepID=UPI0018857F39|nr:gamma-glutamyl hydrolase-like [Pollicipes pollicipes]
MYRYLNGLLLPSGEASVRDTPYVRAVRSVWAVAGKHPKDHFPVLGISRGMEMIAKVEQDRIRFADCDAINMAGQLHIETDGERSSLLRDVDAPLRRALASGSLTYSSHGRCLTPERLEAGGLAEDFRAVATGRDRAGRKFVSVMEHKRLPIFGVQFSPQMSPFEWARSAEVDAVPRAPDAIRLSQLIANAFVDEARKSRHRFPSPELEEDYLIYNYEPEFTGVVGSTYTSCYFFS